MIADIPPEPVPSNNLPTTISSADWTGKLTANKPAIKTASKNAMPSQLQKRLQPNHASNAPCMAPNTNKTSESDHHGPSPKIGDEEICDPVCGCRDYHSTFRIITPIIIATDDTENIYLL